ncbi:MAG: 2'-5' RNA ligase family protein [bacterium]|nr:2'-5' RNA ligase family protein [bacterium]
MKHRIFIAIDLPPELKQRISETITQWRWLPIRWLAPASWHITLVPAVYLENSETETLLELVHHSLPVPARPARLPDGQAGGRQAGRFGKPFPVRFSRVVLAPPGIQARMIWLEGDTPPELVRLKKKIEAAWGQAPGGLPPLKRESRPLALHITLARFEPGELKELESKTHTLGEVDFRFEAQEVTVMESRLKPSGAEYERLAAVPLTVK